MRSISVGVLPGFVSNGLAELETKHRIGVNRFAFIKAYNKLAFLANEIDWDLSLFDPEFLLAPSNPAVESAAYLKKNHGTLSPDSFDDDVPTVEWGVEGAVLVGSDLLIPNELVPYDQATLILSYVYSDSTGDGPVIGPSFYIWMPSHVSSIPVKERVLRYTKKNKKKKR